MESLKRQERPVSDIIDTTSRQGTSRYKPKCYKCGSEDHLRPKCALFNKKGQKPSAEGEGEKHQSKYIVNKSSGLYLDCTINNISTECLVESGATLSILSIKARNVISQHSTSKLKPFKSEILTAPGVQIDVRGKVSVMVDIDGMQCNTEMAVADIDLDPILGLDFLKEKRCQLNMNDNSLLINDRPCKLNMDGKIGCYRITVADKVEIPLQSEVIIEGKVQLPILKTDSLAIIEPIDGSFLTDKGMAAKALVHTYNKFGSRE